jgi:hypothetical protein
MRVLIPLAAIALLGGVAAAKDSGAKDNGRAAQEAEIQQKLAKELQGLTPQKAESCIDQFPSAQTAGYGPTILYKFSDGVVYRTDTAGGCEGIGRGDILVTKTSQSQLCQGDIARTVDAASHMTTGSCSFGPFVPYRKVAP